MRKPNRTHVMAAALLAAAALAACAASPAASSRQESAASPAATEAPPPSPAPAATADPTAAPAPVLPDPAADYALAAADEKAARGGEVPAAGVTLFYSGLGATLAQAAEDTGIPADTLRALNPDFVEGTDSYSSGTTDLLLQQELYQLPDVPVRSVTVPDPGEEPKVYIVPASLDDQASIVMAEAWDALTHRDLSMGYAPSEVIDAGTSLYSTVQGARFTTFSGYKTYLTRIFSAEMVTPFVSGAKSANGWYEGGYLEGDGDALCYGEAARGANIYYNGIAYTEPKTQADGTLRFGMLALLSDDGGEPGGPTTRAEYLAVVLAPTADGWRVSRMSLPY